MKLKNIIRITATTILGFSMVFGISSTSKVNAAPYSIEKLPDTTAYGDFVVGPGKYQVDMKPGETRVVNVVVSNRMGKSKLFTVEIEDFKGSRDLGRPVVLVGNDRGPYSLRDYLKVASSTFNLNNAERVTIPVKISIPTDAQPGGLYGSIVIGTLTSPEEQVPVGTDSLGVNPIVTRIGSLFFIRIAGDIKQDLVLKDFSMKNHRNILGSSPVNFEILYENNGSVHENPYGYIYVTNLFGSEIKKIEVEPWFILPDSLRVREVSWEAPFLFGRYTATAEIKKGYGDAVDTATVAFWVIPWKIVSLVFVSVIVLVAIIRFVLSKIHISFKKK